MTEVIKRIGAAIGVRGSKPDVSATLQDLGIAMESLYPVMRQSSLFSSVGDEELGRLVLRMRPRTVGAGVFVMREGGRARNLMVLLQGDAEILQKRNGDDVTLASVSRLTVIGEECLVGDTAYRASARLPEGGTILELTRSDFGKFAADELVDELAASDVPERTAGGDEVVTIISQREAAKADANPRVTTLGDLHDFIDGDARDTLKICMATRTYKAALAAFLLIQWGYKAVYVKGGRLATARQRR